MALTDGESSGIPATMLVGPTSVGNNAYPYPVYQNSGNNDGFGDGNGWWIVLLIILLAAGNGFGNGYGGGNGGFGGQPIIVNDGGHDHDGFAIQRGFDQAALMSGITGVQNGVNSLSTQLCGCCGDIQSSLCNGFAGVNATVNSGFANSETAANARQMANMNQAFAAQTAMSQGFNGVQSQLADCCCENRLASADLKYTIATENCADRYEAAQNTRDIIQSQTQGTQAILDKLCQLELDGVKAQVEAKNDRISELQTQLNMANLQASQTAQNAFIAQGFSDEVDALYNRLNNCPVPTTPVYGRTPIFTCNQNNGCGCGCGNF